MGEIIGFTTVIDGTSNFAVENANLYPGDNAVFTWDPVSRSLQGYNLYKDGELVNETPITETTYTVEDLEYNMEGYNFQLSVVFDEGESTLTDPVLVKMTGYGHVSGNVYDQDSITPIPNATVLFIVLDEYQVSQTLSYQADANGHYEADVLAGSLAVPGAMADGYANGANIYAILQPLAYGETYTDVNIYLHEFYAPLGMINATEEEDGVLVEWD